MKRSQEGHCGPFNAPAYPPPPYEMTDRTQVLFVFFRADLDAMAFEVPEPLKLAGREVYGWPKQICEDTPLTFHGNQVHGVIRRGGSELLKAIFNPTSPPPSRRTVPEEANFLTYMSADWSGIRKFPSPELGGEPIRQLVHTRLEDARIAEIQAGNASFEIGKSGYYPHMHKLAPVEHVYSAYVRLSFILPHGRILTGRVEETAARPAGELVGAVA